MCARQSIYDEEKEDDDEESSMTQLFDRVRMSTHTSIHMSMHISVSHSTHVLTHPRMRTPTRATHTAHACHPCTYVSAACTQALLSWCRTYISLVMAYMVMVYTVMVITM